MAICSTKVAHRDFTKFSGWAWLPCGRKAGDTGYCSEHGPVNTFKDKS